MDLPGNWVNLNARVGLQFLIPTGAAAPAIVLPKPGARDALTARTPIRPGQDHLLGIIVCLDQPGEQHIRWASKLDADSTDRHVTCVVGPYTWGIGAFLLAACACAEFGT